MSARQVSQQEIWKPQTVFCERPLKWNNWSAKLYVSRSCTDLCRYIWVVILGKESNYSIKSNTEIRGDGWELSPPCPGGRGVRRWARWAQNVGQSTAGFIPAYQVLPSWIPGIWAKSLNRAASPAHPATHCAFSAGLSPSPFTIQTQSEVQVGIKNAVQQVSLPHSHSC